MSKEFDCISISIGTPIQPKRKWWMIFFKNKYKPFMPPGYTHLRLTVLEEERVCKTYKTTRLSFVVKFHVVPGGPFKLNVHIIGPGMEDILMSDFYVHTTKKIMEENGLKE